MPLPVLLPTFLLPFPAAPDARAGHYIRGGGRLGGVDTTGARGVGWRAVERSGWLNGQNEEPRGWQVWTFP